MSKYNITKAWLNRPTLKFKEGAWTAKGRFKLNTGTAGKFELKFYNGYRNEFFITFSPESYKNIRQQTFNTHKKEFQKQAAELVKVQIKECLEEIRASEAELSNPSMKIITAYAQSGSIGVKFKIGENPERILALTKKGDADWQFDMFFLKGTTDGVVTSTWLQELWELAQEHEDIKLPLLF
ncbi:hypothetical protein CON36_33880 [Bacillus cereus]|uniref:Uncharacterized protein n=1 Tax=Bacillus cereus TaxID=1396 RepID=A0A9X6SSN3_BACCE|nr:hypothetical protein [Bacillus cereus]PDZ94425.1 hypothetical protein CON36_33880 [Bacillus cereus]